MDQERAFLASLDAAPSDEVTWQAYADWLEERGDDRGPFLRTIVALALGAVESREMKATAARLRAMRSSLPRAWLARCEALVARVPIRFARRTT